MKPKIIAYTALLYGASYLGYAIRSIIDHVDEYYVLYAAAGGSHGTRVNIPCPESREQLYAIASRAAGEKLRWIDGTWTQEGQQRDSILDICPDADVILALDADEIWPPHTYDGLFWRYLEGVAEIGTYHAFRWPMIHMWRSFYRGVLHDPAFPARVILPKVKGNDVITLNYNPPIVHFGYAQPSSIVQYKMKIHGHRAELRTDIDWFIERFMANAQHDCHPVGSEFWNPEPVNPWDYLPEFMQDHPFAQLEVIP